MSTKQRKVMFAVGDLVRVNDQTHQEGMSPSRLGVVTGIGQDDRGVPTGVYKILFASAKGQVEMTFWHKYLEKVAP